MANFYNEAYGDNIIALNGVKCWTKASIGFIFNDGVVTQAVGNLFSQHESVGAFGSQITGIRHTVTINGSIDINITQDQEYISGYYSGGINTIRIYGFVSAQAPGGGYPCSATFDVTYTLKIIPNGTSGLILMDIPTNSTDKFIYVLPDLGSLQTGNLLMLKNKNRSAVEINIITINGAQRIEYDPQFNNPYDFYKLTIPGSDQFRSACLTLFVDLSGANQMYRIANFYPQRYGASGGYNQINSGANQTVSGNKRRTAIANRINIFNVNAFSERNNGDNEIVLPAAASGALCVVVYAGNSGGGNKGAGNALTFTHVYQIEGPNGPYNNSNNKCFINTDANDKSTGILFVSDGTFWYVVGWYFTVGMAWSTDTSWQGTSLKIPNINIGGPSQITQVRTPQKGIDFYLPDSIPTITDTSTGGLILFKISHDLGNSTMFHTNPQNSGSINSFLNETQCRVYFAFNAGGYSCVWFAYERRANGKLYYYPVIWHTPQYRGGQPGKWSPPQDI